MRRGEVFRLIFTEERVHQTDCVQGIPMTASAIRDIHAVLSGAFKQAMVGGWISHNPVRLTTPPAVEQPDTRPPEVGQAERLIETAMAEDRSWACSWSWPRCWARAAGVCSLRWSDVDFDQGDVLVAGSVIILPGQPLLTVTSPRPGPSAGSRSAPARWSCCAPAESSRPKRRWPRESHSVPTPMSSAVRRTAPSPSASTGCPIGSPSWPASWGSTAGARPAALHGHPAHLGRGRRAHRLGRAGHRDGGFSPGPQP